jgi:hypothetical protein
MGEYLKFNPKNVENIPGELKAGQRWLCWKEEERDGRATKVPISAVTLQECDATDEASLMAFDGAIDCYTNHAEALRLAGVGRAFFAEDGIVGVDFDDCKESDGVGYAMGTEFLGQLNSYSEVSPSGEGCKVWVRGVKPGDHCRNAKLGVEIYSAKRFFTVTGRRLKEYSGSVECRQDVLNALYAAAFTKPSTTRDATTGVTVATRATGLSDEEIVSKAGGAKNGAKFQLLWQGQVEAAGYGSASEADLALCSILRFWSGDRDQVDRLFRQSGCFREKWDRDDYRDRTLDAAFSNGDVYSPRPPHPYVVGAHNELLKRSVTKDKHGNVEENFDAITAAGHLVVDEVLADTSGQKYFRGRIVGDQWEQSFDIPSSVWGNSRKFAETVKGLAGDKVICHGKWNEIAEASELLNPTKRFLRTLPFGWNPDFTAFFGVDCIVTKDGVTAPTDQVFRSSHKNTDRLRLTIPSEPVLTAALRHIKADLMEFNSHEAMQAGLGTVGIAPFRSYFTERGSTTNAVASLILAGTTGDGKTAMATLITCFFGHVRENHLASLNSTPRSINDLGHRYRDAIFTLDDLKWSALASSVQEQVKGILQSYADAHGRDRLARNSAGGFSPETGLEIMGTMVVTAEDLPSGEASFFGRFMIFAVRNRVLDTDRYSRCLEQSVNYGMVTADFLFWFLNQPNHWERLTSRFDVNRKALEVGVPKSMVNTIRVCSQLSLNMAGYTMLITYLTSKGIFTTAESEKLLAEHLARLTALRDERLARIGDETPAEKFLQMVSSLLASKKVKLEDSIDDHVPTIGFIDENILYLHPKVALGEVQKAYDALKERIPFGENAVGQQLKSGGYLVKFDTNRTTVQKRRDGRVQRVYAFNPATVGLDTGTGYTATEGANSTSTTEKDMW